MYNIKYLVENMYSVQIDSVFFCSFVWYYHHHQAIMRPTVGHGFFYVMK